MEWVKEARRGREFWRKMPPRAFAIFLLAVFCLFACFGLIGAVGTTQPWYSILYDGCFSGLIGAGFAWMGTRGLYKAMIGFALLVFLIWPLVLGWLQPGQPALPKASLDYAGVAAVLAVIAGYLLFLWFIGTEGRRHHRLETEVALAGEIHRALAPPLERRAGGLEFAGLSHPSGEVGGDLLDWVATDAGWLAYIADVSGHGVAAGVLMGVVKSAAHAWLAAAAGSAANGSASSDGLLPGLNRVLCELLPPESYVTFAALTPAAGGRLRYAAAGHPPLLHYRAAAGSITPVGVENFPLGMFADASFASVEVDCAPGDILAIFTDGLTEIFAHSGAEFGQEGLGRALSAAAGQPLTEAVAAVAAAAQKFGRQTDDQTLLLVRC